MDYENFKKEYDNFLDWEDYMNVKGEAFMSDPLNGADKDDVIAFKPRLVNKEDKKAFYADDRVNNPSHYTRGGQEAIVTIEEAIQDAPSMPLAFLQGQVLKYLLRCWLKDNPEEDLKKARWYLNRLITKLNSAR